MFQIIASVLLVHILSIGCDITKPSILVMLSLPSLDRIWTWDPDHDQDNQSQTETLDHLAMIPLTLINSFQESHQLLNALPQVGGQLESLPGELVTQKTPRELKFWPAQTCLRLNQMEKDTLQLLRYDIILKAGVAFSGVNFINTKRWHLKSLIMEFKCQKWLLTFEKFHKTLLAF